MNSLQYFGTDTRTAGHYFFKFDATGRYMSSSDIRWGTLSFNPESFTHTGRNTFIPKGQSEYHQIGGYSILAVCGSPIDSRPGCKSVFFMLGDFTQDQLIQKIQMTPAAINIINKMPFSVEIFNHIFTN